MWLATTKMLPFLAGPVWWAQLLVNGASPFLTNLGWLPTNFDVLDWLVQVKLAEIAWGTCRVQKTAFWATKLGQIWSPIWTLCQRQWHFFKKLTFFYLTLICLIIWQKQIFLKLPVCITSTKSCFLVRPSFSSCNFGQCCIAAKECPFF